MCVCVQRVGTVRGAAARNWHGAPRDLVAGGGGRGRGAGAGGRGVAPGGRAPAGQRAVIGRPRPSPRPLPDATSVLLGYRAPIQLDCPLDSVLSIVFYFYN